MPGQSTLFDHLQTIVQLAGILVSGIGPEGEFQAFSLGHFDEFLAWQVRRGLNFKRDISLSRQSNDLHHPLFGP